MRPKFGPIKVIACIEDQQVINKILAHLKEKETLPSTLETQPGISSADFPKASKHYRGRVGVIEVAGIINAGDEVTIKVFQLASWLERLRKQNSEE
jgi:hypothetical protein